MPFETMSKEASLHDKEASLYVCWQRLCTIPILKASGTWQALSNQTPLIWLRWSCNISNFLKVAHAAGKVPAWDNQLVVQDQQIST